MSKTLIIAEAGVNHDGSIEKARELIEGAAVAGADMVKFQTFSANALATAAAPKATYQQRSTDIGESQLAMLKRLELPLEQHAGLKAFAEERGVTFLSTPFDSQSAQFLINLGLTTLKIGSGDMTNAPLLLEIARSGVKLILSTGMARLAEIEDALGVLAFGYSGLEEMPSRRAFAESWADPACYATMRGKVQMLHCTTEYPCPPEDANLSIMATLRSAFGLPVGFSDHCEGPAVSVAAVALGATVIEKHITLDRAALGPDHAASMEPDSFGEMVRQIRTVERALGDGRKVPRPSETPNIAVARKSLVASNDLAAGAIVQHSDVTCKRPGGGRAPIELWDVVGTTLQRPLLAGEAFD
ncbi:MAG: N-acetylneuraminate synthase [Candidatus Devosia symbiotica]|nr:N-acetylneuraminate synthase [Candidatus Devosia symbiotica]